MIGGAAYPIPPVPEFPVTAVHRRAPITASRIPVIRTIRLFSLGRFVPCSEHMNRGARMHAAPVKIRSSERPLSVARVISDIGMFPY